MALRFLVEEELTSHLSPLTSHLLLTAYTNRAVDEICAMLEDAGLDYIRIAAETACDPRFTGHLLEAMLGEKPKLDDIRRRIGEIRIVVGTTLMLQARPWIFQLKHFSLCIVDEASQILEPNLVGVLASDSIDRFILIGDHKQLPAVVQQSEEESRVDNPLLNAIGISDCRQSLFERLLRWEQHEGRTQFTGILRKQGRMHPDIAAFPNELFYRDEQLEPVPLEHQLDASLHYDQPSQDALDDLLKQERVVFLDSETPDASEIMETYKTNKANQAEARIVADLLRRICRFYGDRFEPGKTVGVIVPYRNQIAMIRQEVAQLGLPQLEQISIDTVERYQGSQRDVIIYSFTVTRPDQLDFLTSNCFEENDGGYPSDSHTIDRKLNVAITRARKQLLLTGNKEILSRNDIFRQLIARYQKIIY
jgi:superfamily I DNA and/or RNA helicase